MGGSASAERSPRSKGSVLGTTQPAINRPSTDAPSCGNRPVDTDDQEACECLCPVPLRSMPQGFCNPACTAVWPLGVPSLTKRHCDLQLRCLAMNSQSH